MAYSEDYLHIKNLLSYESKKVHNLIIDNNRIGLEKRKKILLDKKWNFDNYDFKDNEKSIIKEEVSSTTMNLIKKIDDKLNELNEVKSENLKKLSKNDSFLVHSQLQDIQHIIQYIENNKETIENDFVKQIVNGMQVMLQKNVEWCNKQISKI